MVEERTGLRHGDVTLRHSSIATAAGCRSEERNKHTNLTTNHHASQRILLLRHPNRQCWHLRRPSRTARLRNRGRHTLCSYFIK